MSVCKVFYTQNFDEILKTVVLDKVTDQLDTKVVDGMREVLGNLLTGPSLISKYFVMNKHVYEHYNDEQLAALT
jgi:hypothetical protein